jgi:hypothetical protein
MPSAMARNARPSPVAGHVQNTSKWIGREGTTGDFEAITAIQKQDRVVSGKQGTKRRGTRRPIFNPSEGGAGRSLIEVPDHGISGCPYGRGSAAADQITMPTMAARDDARLNERLPRNGARKS